MITSKATPFFEYVARKMPFEIENIDQLLESNTGVLLDGMSTIPFAQAKSSHTPVLFHRMIDLLGSDK